MTRRAVFLDRDGVINANRTDYVKTREEFVFLPGALEALRRLAALPLAIVVTTNQSAVGRGITTSAVVDGIHRHMLDTIAAAGGRVDLVRYCPHRPEDHCACRKPAPGLLLESARLLDLDLAASYMIGDAASDVEAGQRAGCLAILVRSGRGRMQQILAHQPFVVVDNLDAAVDFIAQREEASKAG